MIDRFDRKRFSRSAAFCAVMVACFVVIGAGSQAQAGGKLAAPFRAVGKAWDWIGQRGIEFKYIHGHLIILVVLLLTTTP